MIPAFRIVQHRFASSAFSGEGARLYGGRWNHPGTRMIYLAGSVSLAQLELLVHLESDEILRQRYILLPVQIPERAIHILSKADLPADWRAETAPPSTRHLGDRWVRAGAHLCLRVPSVVVPQESNYLLNPDHPEFSTLTIGPPQELRFDPRLT